MPTVKTAKGIEHFDYDAKGMAAAKAAKATGKKMVKKVKKKKMPKKEIGFGGMN